MWSLIKITRTEDEVANRWYITLIIDCLNENVIEVLSSIAEYCRTVVSPIRKFVHFFLNYTTSVQK